MKAVTIPLTRGAQLADLIELTKPRITLMVVMTTAVGLLVAGVTTEQSAWLVVPTLLGTWLLAGGASALNQWWEREFDARMPRTRNRPIPGGRLEGEVALGVGFALGLFGVGILALWVNPLTALVGLLTYAVYVLIYTPLKRRTVWSTVIGALPGALPPVMGWTAVRGELDAPAGALFAILFCWQLPHFLAIDWMFRDDYRAGGFRTLATTDTSGARSGRWMIVSTIALAIASVLPVAIGNAGLLYLVVAIVLAGVFLYRAFGFAASPQQETARSAMLYSVLYLPVLLAALVVDSLL